MIILNPYMFAAPVPTPIAWYKADAITGLSDGDPLSTWVNYGSGSGYDITGSGSVRPLYKTGIINGLPTVRFDGTDDVLGTSSNVIFSTGCTIFAVSKNRISKDYNGIMRIGSDFTSNSYVEVYYYDITGGYANAVFSVNRSSSLTYIIAQYAGPVENNYYIGCWENTGSALNQYINGTLQTVFAGSGSTYTIVDGKLFVGIGYQTGGVIDGDIAELHIYSPALTTDERNAVFATLNSKYAIY